MGNNCGFYSGHNLDRFQVRTWEKIMKLGFYAGTPENSVTKAKKHLICMTLNK
ncbi:hypothetical protein GA0061070_10392 [Kosakonia oryziphila]|uniref:Uncharacterized protein n=1 Tax=Kosakonia oryziphila TaxID=1005667 RepID=A0A1C4FMG0_9ENTR|nr:hypothetical protein GA0061070_10392 [Kosakonia oryziphila]